jgi:hypothetical protein
MRTFNIKGLFLSLLFAISISSIAHADIVRIPSDSGPSAKLEMTFDGIWVGPNNVTLIKQLDGYIVLQGKDSMSTWWARGVINGDTITCRGSGVTNNGDQFVYESTMELKDDDVLEDSWKAIFVEGKTLQGDDALKKVKVQVLDKTDRTAQ